MFWLSDYVLWYLWEGILRRYLDTHNRWQDLCVAAPASAFLNTLSDMRFPRSTCLNKLCMKSLTLSSPVLNCSHWSLPCEMWSELWNWEYRLMDTFDFAALDPIESFPRNAQLIMIETLCHISFDDKREPHVIMVKPSILARLVRQRSPVLHSPDLIFAQRRADQYLDF